MGESPRLAAVAEVLEEAVQRESGRGTVLEARKNISLVGGQGGGGGFSARASAAAASAGLEPSLPVPTIAAASDCRCRRRTLQGLVVRDRGDAEELHDYKLPYAQVGGAGAGAG